MDEIKNFIIKLENIRGELQDILDRVESNNGKWFPLDHIKWYEKVNERDAIIKEVNNVMRVQECH